MNTTDNPSANQPAFKCYVTAPETVNLDNIIDLLTKKRFQVMVSSKLQLTSTTVLKGIAHAISDGDLFLAILGEEQQNARIYIEIGIALAKGLRMLIVSPPNIHVPVDIAEIPTIRVDEKNSEAISFALDQVLIAPGSIQEEVYPSDTLFPSNTLFPRSQPLGPLADQILERFDHREENRPPEVEVVRLLSQALQASGLHVNVEMPLYALNSEPQREILRSRVDLVAWSEEFDAWIGNPLIIEVKTNFRKKADLNNALEQVKQYLTRGQLRSALIVYLVNPNASSNFKEYISLSLSGEHDIFLIEFHDLISELRTKSFPKILKDLRNRLVHGGTKEL